MKVVIINIMQYVMINKRQRGAYNKKMRRRTLSGAAARTGDFKEKEREQYNNIKEIES